MEKRFLNVGRYFMTGISVTKNEQKAIEFSQKSEDLENHNALLILGNCYHKEKGVKLNKSIAFEYF